MDAFSIAFKVTKQENGGAIIGNSVQMRNVNRKLIVKNHDRFVKVSHLQKKLNLVALTYNYEDHLANQSLGGKD